MTAAEIEIPSTASLTDFITVKGTAEPIDGLTDLRCTVSGMLSLRSFRFF